MEPQHYRLNSLSQINAYTSALEERISNYLLAKSFDFSTKKMMGGLCYLLNDKMLAGIVKDQLMVRIAPELYKAAVVKDECN